MNANDGKEDSTCHGQCSTLLPCSETRKIGFWEKKKNRIWVGFSNLRWWIKEKGITATMNYLWTKRILKKQPKNKSESGTFNIQEVLNLQPGEHVEVRSEEEILATLNENRRYKGLLWMAGMNKHCGKQYRVWKRLEIMLIESTGEYRKVKNTVLLEGVMCDGKAFNGCGRSCFFLWREAWLKRI